MFDLQHISQAVRHEGGVSRRLFMAYGAALAALPSLALRAEAAPRRVSFVADPFQLGVASGDPADTSVVLWTRLCPRPLDIDYGIGAESIPVRWELADNEAMTRNVRRGMTVATPQLGHSVHVEVEGLKPGRHYWYRFLAGNAVSPVGRTRTLPSPQDLPDRLRFAFASCQHYETGLFTAYDQMAKDDPDLVFHLGDYIYEGPGKDNLVRKHNGPRTTKLLTLQDYRSRYAQYRADPLLQGMHRQCPWFMTWDDHEFDNNYAGAISEKAGVDPAVFLIQRAAAYQAYYEMMPLRASSLPQGPDMQLYRKAGFGRLAEFLILDTRQYRTDQPNGDGRKPLNANALDPKNSLLGSRQRGWMDASLLASQANWNVFAQQVMMGMVGFQGTPEVGDPVYSMDQWPGAAHERMAIARFLAERRVANPVVLTGDIHSNWVNDIRVDDRKMDLPVVATEFVGTSISSGGNGTFDPKDQDQLRARNPFVRFFSRERGYVRCEVTPQTWRSDYVAVEDVTRPGGRTQVRRSFMVESGVPGAQAV